MTCSSVFSYPELERRGGRAKDSEASLAPDKQTLSCPQ